MPLSRGARALLSFFKSKANSEGVCWWSQPRIAEATGYGVRSIGRFIAELSAAGDLETVRRAASSNIYKPSGNAVDNEESIRPKWLNDSAKMADPSIELNLKTKNDQAEEFSYPVEFTVNACGRRDPNPEWLAVQAALRNAKDSISAARNPVAYERAVVRNALRKPQGRQTA